MSQIVAEAPNRPLTPAESVEFSGLAERLRNPAELNPLNIVTTDADEIRRCRVVVPKTLSSDDLRRLRLLAAQQLTPMRPDDAEAVATRLLSAFPMDRYTNPAVFFELLAALLESVPVAAGRAMTDPRNPESLIRQSKFPPSLAEVSAWAENFMRKLLPSGQTISCFLAALETLDRLKALPGFQIEEDRP